jgi:hypothetical protein
MAAQGLCSTKAFFNNLGKFKNIETIQVSNQSIE